MDFGTVIIVVSIVAVLIAAVSYWGSGRVYGSIGDSDLVMRRETATSAPDSAEAREEIRQMLMARNERRRRQGKEPLDVDAEVERQLRALGA